MILLILFKISVQRKYELFVIFQTLSIFADDFTQQEIMKCLSFCTINWKVSNVFSENLQESQAVSVNSWSINIHKIITSDQGLFLI